MARFLLLVPMLLALMGAPASAMSYALVRLNDGRCSAASCPQAIFAVGTIELDEPQRLLAFAQSIGAQGPIPANLILHSPGGNLAGALALGLGVRRLGMKTIVASLAARGPSRAGLAAGRCASACVFVLMGGRSRIVPNGSRVLVHSPRRAGIEQHEMFGGGMTDGVARAESVAATLAEYTRAMGVDPALVSLTYTVPHESARVLTRAELVRFRLATAAR